MGMTRFPWLVKQRRTLIILDLMMPELSGFETLKLLRDGSATQLVPVIMLTGVSDKRKIREAIDLGINYYLVKPFEFHDLVAKVKLAIQDSESQLA